METLITKYEAMQFLEKNIEENLWSLGLGEECLYLTERQSVKRKTGKLDLTKIKNFSYE